MGKTQGGNRTLTAMDIDDTRSVNCGPTSNRWPWDDDFSTSCRKSTSLLDTCHNRLHPTGVTIGSPPPKPVSPLIADASEVSHNGDAIFRIHVPTADGENNNYQPTANGFSIGDTLSEINPVTQGNCGSHHKGEVDAALSVRVQGLQLQESMTSQLQHPIIVCEEADDAEGEIEEQLCDDDSALSLSVPTVDVAEEKKRPPLPDGDTY